MATTSPASRVRALKAQVRRQARQIARLRQAIAVFDPWEGRLRREHSMMHAAARRILDCATAHGGCQRCWTIAADVVDAVYSSDPAPPLPALTEGLSQ